MKRTLIQNAVIVNEGRKVLGSVVIENEKIAEILVGEENATRIIISRQLLLSSLIIQVVRTR